MGDGKCTLAHARGKKENEEGVGVSPGFSTGNKGCEPVLYHVSSANVEVTAAAPDSAISLCCH